MAEVAAVAVWAGVKAAAAAGRGGDRAALAIAARCWQRWRGEAVAAEAGEYLGERDHPATGMHMIYYAARPTHGTEIHLGDKGELTEVRWVSLAEADELLPGMFGPVRAYLVRKLGEV